MKFPLLDQLRAERERAEAEITLPYRQELDGMARLVSGLREALRSLEKIVGTEIGKHVTAEIACCLAAELRRQIMEALVAAGNPRAEPVTVTFSAETLRFMDPNSLEREVLGRYVSQSIPSLRLSARMKPDEMVTVMDVRIPELGFRQMIAA